MSGFASGGCSSRPRRITGTGSDCHHLQDLVWFPVRCESFVGREFAASFPPLLGPPPCGTGKRNQRQIVAETWRPRPESVTLP